MQRTSFSLADQCEEAGLNAMKKAKTDRREKRNLHLDAADMIRNLSIRLHRERSKARIVHAVYCVVIILTALMKWGQ